MFDDDRRPELHVPAEALRKPAGAEVGDDGRVACIGCGTRIALASADIVGQGYRCTTCTQQAQLAALERGQPVDAGAHLSRGARAHLRTEGTRMMVGGAAALGLGVILFIATFDTSASKLGAALGTAGAGLLIVGGSRRSAAG